MLVHVTLLPEFSVGSGSSYRAQYPRFTIQLMQSTVLVNNFSGRTQCTWFGERTYLSYVMVPVYTNENAEASQKFCFPNLQSQSLRIVERGYVRV